MFLKLFFHKQKSQKCPPLQNGQFFGQKVASADGPMHLLAQ
jgi:hypothetical protein